MITLYSKPLCPYCDNAENYLKKNSIDYRKVDISEDTAAYEFVKSKGHKTVPQIYLEGKILVEGGYDGLKALLPMELEKRIQQHVNGSKDL
jgi:glutaredoxin 3